MMGLGEVGWIGMDWSGLAQDRDKWTALWMRQWTFGFNKMLENYQVATQLAASRVVLFSINLVVMVMLQNW
jgi:hypothetical protein